MNIFVVNDAELTVLGQREFFEGDLAMVTKKKHRVSFEAHRTVVEEVPVRFRTRDGERISFDAHKKIKEPVRVKFTARDK